MRIIILGVLLLFMFCSVAVADVTWEVVGKDLDENGNIRVKTAYFVDGVNVQTKYAPLNGKYYSVVRFNSINFAEMTAEQIDARIKTELNNHASNLTQREFIKKQNATIEGTLGGLVGDTGSIKSSIINIDSDGDGQLDKEYTVKTDGTKTVKDIIPVPAEL